MAPDSTKGKLHLIQEDLDSFESWVDEGFCKLETLLEKYRVFHELHGA